MDFHEALQRLQKSATFSEWKQEHEDFLAHAFVMLDKENENIWQFGYYNGQTMTTFILDNEAVEVLPEQKILESGQPLEELNEQDVQVSVQEALDKAEEIRKENYPQEQPVKKFFIIQSIDGAIYNITYFTMSFSTINIRIDAKTGEILKHDKKKLAEPA